LTLKLSHLERHSRKGCCQREGLGQCLLSCFVVFVVIFVFADVAGFVADDVDVDDKELKSI
jgi:hypothetical protein